ncbi:MAG: group II intron reverse transcriptase/maturase [Mycobacteriales bacterium]
MQTKLHQWAKAGPGRRFDDVFNLVYDPAVLVVAWSRVRSNKGARTAGVDGIAPRDVDAETVRDMLVDLREDLKGHRFVPQLVREKTIPKTSGKIRRLGIATTRDRIVQAALKLVLEPIFEADFKPCSYGFRPKRRAQDAIAEIHYLATPTRNYQWVFGADIAAFFEEISHLALVGRVRDRIGDKRVLNLVKAFLRAGLLTEDGHARQTSTGTPQGGILSPLMANIALSVLDEHFTAKWEALGPDWKRVRHRRSGGPSMKIIRYADDFVVMINGTRDHAEALWDEVAAVLAPMGLRLSEAKTKVCHVDEGFDFLGWHIQRRRWSGRTGKQAVYTYPSKNALASVMATVRSLTRRAQHRTLADLLRRINPVLRGWCNYFRHGVSSRTFSYLDHFAFWRVFGWLTKRHLGLNKHTLVRRFLPGWVVRDGDVEMFRPQTVAIVRYRYRGSRIPTPWSSEPTPASPVLTA